MSKPTLKNRPLLSALTHTLTLSPAGLMEQEEARYQDNDDGSITVHYLGESDGDGSHPFNDCDGNGKLISHLHGQHDEQCQALGLTELHEHNLSLIDEDSAEFRAAWIDYATDSVAFVTWANANHNAYTTYRQTSDLDNTGTPAYYRQRAADAFDGYRKYIDNQPLSRADVDVFEAEGMAIDLDHTVNFTHEAKEAVWQQLQLLNKIGTPDHVILDCFRHSSENWALKGEGVQCRFDTSSFAGVWVPDESATQEIDRRAPVYEIGYIQQNQATMVLGQSKGYTVMVDVEKNSPTEDSEYDSWSDAFEHLSTLRKAHVPSALAQVVDNAPTIALGRRRASEELARNAMDEYNSWANGEVYSTVSANLSNVAIEGHEPIWEENDFDSCCGYVGDAGAKDALAEIDGMIECAE
jgi:hypothetical protein